MCSIKSESFGVVDEGDDSQCIRQFDDNLHVSDMFSVNTSTTRFRPDENLSKEMLLTVAHVKKEQNTSNELDYNTSSSKGYEGLRRQTFSAKNAIKTERTEACTNNTSGNVVDKEAINMESTEACTYNTFGNVVNKEAIKMESTEACTNSTSRNIVDEKSDKKELLQHYLIGEIDYNLTVDISQHGRKSKREVINMEIISSKGYIKSHEDMAAKEKPYKCDVCQYRTTRPSHLKTHKLIHTGEKPYKCDECDYNTTTSWGLKRHKLKHSGDKPYSCDLCDFTARQYVNLETHKLMHSGAKPYKCDECDYSSTQYGNLKTHKLKHSGERPYKCELCDYSTTTSSKLKDHNLTHTGENQYCCNLCIKLYHYKAKRSEQTYIDAYRGETVQM